MKYLFLAIVTIILGFCSCTQDTSRTHITTVEIAGRDEGHSSERPVIYRVKVPGIWIQKNPTDESIADSTKSIMEFFIVEGDEKIRIAIHNFPSENAMQRIPPLAQVNRWKRQFQTFESSSLISQAFGGYYGFLFDAIGTMQNNTVCILGWALQLAPEHYQTLAYSSTSKIERKYRQMRGDVTIKATGSKQLMDKYREDIIAFARSFQLIDDF